MQQSALGAFTALVAGTRDNDVVVILAVPIVAVMPQRY